MAKIPFFTLALSICYGIGFAVDCPDRTLSEVFFDPASVTVIRAIYQGATPLRGVWQTYSFAVDLTFKGCSTDVYELRAKQLSTQSQGGPPSPIPQDILVGTSYVLVIPEGNHPRAHDCMYIRPYDSLSSLETNFLKTRKVCCNGQCTCNVNTICIVTTCGREAPPCDDAINCDSTPCTDCYADWFTADGTDVRTHCKNHQLHKEFMYPQPHDMLFRQHPSV